MGWRFMRAILLARIAGAILLPYTDRWGRELMEPSSLHGLLRAILLASQRERVRRKCCHLIGRAPALTRSTVAASKAIIADNADV